MDLFNEQVMHRTYGVGCVESVENGYITVEFSGDIGQRVFSYPGAFERFLKVSNPEAQAAVERDLNELQARLAEEKAEKERTYREEQERLQAERLELLAMRRLKNHRTKPLPK